MSTLGRSLVSFVSLGFVALGLGACTFASPIHSTYNESDESDLTGAEGSSGDATPASTSPAPATPAACEGNQLTAIDVSTLTACGDGKGHCYDKGKLPYLAEELDACTGNDVCVPDSMLTSGGDTPKSCTSVIGAGGCASLLVKGLAKNQGSLTQDVCAAGEICAPCVDPTKGNAPTPFCSAFGVYETSCAGAETGSSSGGAVTPPPVDTACCKKADGTSAGMCLVETAIPEDQREDTDQQECSGGNKCVPAPFALGEPVACEIGLWDGVCLDQCFSSYLETVGETLSSDDCGATEACVPCFLLPDNTPGCAT